MRNSIKRPYGLWPCGFMALWPYEHVYVVYIYGKCRPLNLCQNMQKKVKMDCIHKMPIECDGVNSKETVRTAQEDDPENACLEGFSVHAECGSSCCKSSARAEEMWFSAHARKATRVLGIFILLQYTVPVWSLK